MTDVSSATMEALREVSDLLRLGGIEEPEREAELLLCHTLGVGRTELYRETPVVDAPAAETLRSLVERRLRREPLQYITGCVEFYGLVFTVGRGVLVPRPETELLVEEAIKVVRNSGLSAPCVLDLCTGTGCIAIAVARGLPASRVIGSDISETAIDYARRNAELNGVNNVTFLRGDLFEPVKGRRFHLILSNPPYVRSSDIAGLQQEVRGYEPLVALDGGADGLALVRRVLEGLPLHLEDRGYALLELGQGQSDAVAGIAEEKGCRVVGIVEDLSGIERVMILVKRG